MKEIWRSQCCDCDCMLEWVEGNQWICGCEEE